MRVVKRNGQTEAVQFDKITQRLQQQVNREPVLKNVDPVKVAMATISSIHDMVTTEELDRESARISGSLQSVHPDYSALASRVMISNLHKSTPNTFSECMKKVQDHMNKEFDVDYIHPKYLEFIISNASAIDSMVDPSCDYEIDHYAYKNYEKSYLIRLKNHYVHKFDDKGNEIGAPTFPICDRPCYLTMRVAIAIYAGVFGPAIENPLDEIRFAYRAMSDMDYTHATPTLLNSLAVNQQLASCFILGTEDSREGIMKSLSDTSAISKSAGGIGIAQHCIRPSGSIIRGTNGTTRGLPKQLVLYNANARCWDQGGDKRPGAFAQYLEPWHGDIMSVLKMRLPGGTEENRTRDLFYGLWIPDLFIKRAREGSQWSLFGANIAPGLQNVYDGQLVCKYTHTEPSGKYTDFIHKIYGVPTDEQLSLANRNKSGEIIHEYEPRNVFTDLYEMYERQGLAHKVISIKELLDAIFDSQREAGMPYICFKDHINRQSNQLNIGTIEASNLCTEIYEWFSSKSYATCTLASINCTKHVTWDVESQKYTLDSAKVVDTTMQVTRNLDNVINVNKFPVVECEQNAYDYRPIGIGTSGLSDAFNLLEIPFDSVEATIVDQDYFESMYYGAIKQSMLDAKKLGSYTEFKGSPASQGRLRFHLWIENQTRSPSPLVRNYETNIYDAEVRCPDGTWIRMFSGKYDWAALIEEVKTHGLRHSLHIALMPTATSAALIGNNDSFEPHPALIYEKTTKIGKHEVCNANAIRHLHRLGLWTESIRLRVINDQGSIQLIDEIPQDIKDIYKTVWEIKQVNLQHRSALRYAWVDQGQSLNIHATKNTNAVLRGLLFRGHELGLGTGSYYIRTLPAVEAQKNNIAANSTTIVEAKLIMDGSNTSDCCGS
jgi:ribonucleoside-diphosphate reductase alpha chain